MDNITLIDRALAVLTNLREAGHSSAIAGGAARDCAHLEKFRDIDIIVVSQEPLKLYELLSEQGFVLCENHNYGQQEVDAELDSVWKHPYLERIDVIVYNNNLYNTVDECVTSGFDCNMSQYILEHVVQDSWNVRVVHNDTDKVVRLLRDDVSITRMERLIEIADNIGWDATELQKRVTVARELEGKIPTFG